MTRKKKIYIMRKAMLLGRRHARPRNAGTIDKFIVRSSSPHSIHFLKFMRSPTREFARDATHSCTVHVHLR